MGRLRIFIRTFPELLPGLVLRQSDISLVSCATATSIAYIAYDRAVIPIDCVTLQWRTRYCITDSDLLSFEAKPRAILLSLSLSLSFFSFFLVSFTHICAAMYTRTLSFLLSFSICLFIYLFLFFFLLFNRSSIFSCESDPGVYAFYSLLCCASLRPQPCWTSWVSLSKENINSLRRWDKFYFVVA